MRDDSYHWGVLESQQDEELSRATAASDPETYHAAIAKKELHWFDPNTQAWLKQCSSEWQGWDSDNGNYSLAGDSWCPWGSVLDSSNAPFYRWFVGAQTNACFNEVDRHILEGRGTCPALIFEGDRWDPSKNGGRGGPVHEQRYNFRDLLLEVALRARVLIKLGLDKGDRIALNLPNIPDQIFYILAAQRLGIIYTPVFGGFSAKTLSDRIHDAGAKIVITADGGYRNAEVVPYKSTYTDPALDNYIPRASALVALSSTLRSLLSDDVAGRLEQQVAQAVSTEITLERADVMRELGLALQKERGTAPEIIAELRTKVATQLAKVSHDIERVIVVRYTGNDIVKHERDDWSHELIEGVEEEFLAEARTSDVRTIQLMDDKAFWCAVGQPTKAVPVEADWPLFVIYTSGSTGKPKGVVHTHGGWLAGITHTMRTVFNAEQTDCLYVIGDPGWITGQSYLIAAPLAFGMSTVVVEGSPLFPHAGRFASIIERNKVTLFKAGSTFLKAVMTDPASNHEISRYDMSSLKVGTFCAEPVSPAVQQFAMDNICPRYINSYWATEHGGIVFSCPWGDFKPLKADAKTWPLPWVQAEVRVAEETDQSGVVSRWREAETGEKGELVITKPYPYLARTLWGQGDQLGSSNWQGDIERFADVYFRRWKGELTYTQGDYARCGDEGAFTLHGRSDDVINVSGHRIGTEEIEGAILRDKTLREDSPVGNVVVVGSPHDEKGETPVAFLVAAAGRKLSDEDLTRLQNLVRSEKGATAVPSDFLVVSAFPETRSGKYMRRTLRSILLEQPLGDLSTLRNPESVDEIKNAVRQWRDFGKLAEARQIIQTWRYLRVENHRLSDQHKVALLIINHPPVNALNERTLDELHTVIQQLEHQDDVDAVVITGSRGVFVAGADVKELLEVGEAGDIESARTPPNAAQAAFAALEQLGKPVIAAVNGPALGGGNELVLACSYVIASPHAQFGQPEINLNLLPGYGGTQRLIRKLYRRRGDSGIVEGVRLIISGRNMTASEARDCGLVDEVVTESEGSPVDIAMHRLRQHFQQHCDLIAVAQNEHNQSLANREKSIPYSDSLLQQPALQQALTQIRASGRIKPAERILEAVAFGANKGQTSGLLHEATLFAEAVCDPSSGPEGITAFLEKRSAALPTRYTEIGPDASAEQIEALTNNGDLLPMGASFFAGITPIPKYQYGYGVPKSSLDGKPSHGDPIEAEVKVIFQTPSPEPNEALVYILASEMNFNDIWAITGIPVSPFDARDADIQVTGSGGVAMIVRLGSALIAEGRLSIGDICTIYSGQSELLSPDQGLDPMAADFRIQGYERNDGSHAQFLTVQGPQLHAKLPGLSIEDAGSYGLTLGTIHRALYRTLDIQPGKNLFVEGASTGTGYDCLRSAINSGLSVVGMVSNPERGARVKAVGGAPIDRKDPSWEHAFTPVPDDPKDWAAWEQAGEAFVNRAMEYAGGKIDYVVSHAGETAFPRSFQTLGEGGVLAFYGASSGYRFTFMGKPGNSSPAKMFTKASLRAGQSLLIVYGPGANDGIVDRVAIEAIEVGCQRGAQIAVLVDTVPQREFVTSLGFGANVRGVVSLEEIERRLGKDFDAPGPFPQMPNPFTESQAFKESVRLFSDRTLKPIGSAIAPFLRNTLDKRGLPDVIFERSGRDGLALATSLVKPNLGKVVYSEDLIGQRFTFYAPQVWMRQRRILMPSAEIRGTHLNTAREFAEMQGRIAAGHIDVLPPVAQTIEKINEIHQAMWENRHDGANYVVTHALPRMGLKTKDELYRAWALRDAADRGETITKVETGSAGALR